MKVILVGASGIIGKAVDQELSWRHEVVRVNRSGGSFTLTSGLLNDEPIRGSVSAGLVNGGLEGFVKGAAVELPRGVRINLVSPTVIAEALPTYGPFFRGFKSVPASEAALGYARSVEGAQTGRVYRIGWTRELV